MAIYKELIIKSKDEEKGESYWKVKVPSYLKDNEIKKILEMATKYANLTMYDDTDADQYDENVEEMVNFRENTNGEETFNYYLTEIHHWVVEPLKIDFEYIW